MKSNKYVGFIGAAVLILALYFLQSNIKSTPDYNWDSIPYMNLILKYDGVENDSIRHATTYQKLKEEVPLNHWELLAETDHWFRLNAYQKPQVLTEQTSFYSIKPFYISCSWLLYKVGFSLFDATWVPSLISFYLIALLFFFYIRIKKNDMIAFVASLLLMLTPPFMGASNMSSPDLMGTFTLMLLTIFYLEKKSMFWLLFISLITILIRPDHLIICGFILGLKALEEPEIKSKIKVLLIPSLIMLIVHIVNYSIHSNPGWKVLFMHSFQGNIHDPITQSEGRVWEWSEYWKSLKLSFHSISFFFWMSLAPLLFLIPSKIKFSELLERKDFMLFTALIITTIIKFFLFPYTIDRYYAPFYAMTILIFLYQISKMEIQINRLNK